MKNKLHFKTLSAVVQGDIKSPKPPKYKNGWYIVHDYDEIINGDEVIRQPALFHITMHYYDVNFRTWVYEGSCNGDDFTMVQSDYRLTFISEEEPENKIELIKKYSKGKKVTNNG